MDEWGLSQRVRLSSDLLYGIARFFAYGGSWHNFYVFAGGNNYGRQSGGNATTGYAPDASVDYLLLHHEPRFSYYQKFFHIIADYSDDLLSNPIAKAQVLLFSDEGSHIIEVHVYGNVAFLSNLDKNITHAVSFNNPTYIARNHSVSVISLPSGSVVFDTADAIDDLTTKPSSIPQTYSSTTTQMKIGNWQWHQEVPSTGAKALVSSDPVEQLELTDNDSDYMWYTTSLPVGIRDVSDIRISTLGDTIVYPYVDGVPASLSPGDTLKSTLQILSCAMGLTNVNVSPHVGKGIHGNVSISGTNIPIEQWTHTWFLPGEANEIYTPIGEARVSWHELVEENSANMTITWFKTHFDLLKVLPSNGQANTADFSYALDLGTMWKGVAYVNGFNIGRYWLEPGQCFGECAPPLIYGKCYMYFTHCGKPTQQVYHIPTEILREKDNLLVLFEEMHAPKGKTRDPNGVELVLIEEHSIIL